MKYDELVAERENNPLWKHFEAYKIGLWSLLKNDINSDRNILIVTGQGGTGKSEEFKNTCARYHVQPVMMSSDTSWQQYVRQLHRYMNAHTICLDDKGNMDTAPTICEHTKGAFSGDRFVRHNIVGTENDPAPPPEFKVTARLVWITNKKFVKKHLKSTFNALMTRGTHIDMDEGVSDEDVFQYTLLLGTQIFQKYPDSVKIDTLNYFNDKRNWLKHVSMRSLVHIAWVFDRDRRWRERGGTPKYTPYEILNTNELNMKERTDKDKIKGLDKKLTILDGQWKDEAPNLQVLFGKQLSPKKAKTKEK